MSKFCGVISNQAGERLPEEPSITFQYLEMLADALISETEQLHGEFIIKCEFQQEKQNKIMDNEQNLRDMHYNMLALSTGIQTIETEVQQNSIDLKRLEADVNMLERVTACVDQRQRPQSEHEHVLRLLQCTDNVMMCLSKLMTELGECEQTLQQQSNPYNIIFEILNFHVRTLQQTDKNLDTLQDKSSAIDESIRQLLEKISAAATTPQTKYINNSLCYCGSQQNFQ